MRNVFVSYSHRLDQSDADDFRRKFGDSVKDDENVEFIYDEFIIDKTWKISCIWGQSCFYSLEKI